MSQIVSRFSQSCATYDQHADVQRQAASILANILARTRVSLVGGTILELGCGTGLLSEHLASMFQDRPLTISDASFEMLAATRNRLESRPFRHKQIDFKLRDANEEPAGGPFALITSSFTFHWLVDVQSAMAEMINALKSGGQLVFCVPIQGSFDEIRELCDQLDLPYPFNVLPSSSDFFEVASAHACEFTCFTETLKMDLSEPLEVFKMLKGLGAHTRTSPTEISVGNLLHILRNWDSSPVSLSYEVLFGCMRR